MMLRNLLALPLLTLSLARVDAVPVSPLRVVAPYRAPATAYGAGHRGVDLAASLGQTVVSPIAGIIAFRGMVAGRPVLTVSDGHRLVSLEPVESTLTPGDVVFAGAVIGEVGIGGHCSLRCVHLGLRIDGEYVAPLGLHIRLVP